MSEIDVEFKCVFLESKLKSRLHAQMILGNVIEVEFKYRYKILFEILHE